jgi:hypothetical protein
MNIEDIKIFFSEAETWLTTFDGGEPPAGDPPAGDPPAGDPPAGDPPAGGGGQTTFSQEDVNRFLATEKRKFRETEAKLMEEVNAMKARTDLTANERQDLETRMEEMRKKHLSKEELAKETAERAQREHEEAVKELTTDRDTWQSRFTESTIERSIALLKPQTQLVEEKDESGEKTGKLVPQVNFQTTNEAGESVTIFLSAQEAVKRMSDMDEYLNLFRNKGVGGIGSGNRNKAGNVDLARLARENPTEYMRLKKEGKI